MHNAQYTPPTWLNCRVESRQRWCCEHSSQLAHNDCWQVRSHRRHDATRLRCWQICSESSKLSPTSCEFRTQRRRDSSRQLSHVGVGGVHWAQHFPFGVCCISNLGQVAGKSGRQIIWRVVRFLFDFFTTPVLLWSVYTVTTVWVKKNPPWNFLTFFPKRLGIFSQNFARLLQVPIYAGLQILFNYLQLWRSYAILSATTIICSKCLSTIDRNTRWVVALNVA